MKFLKFLVGLGVFLSGTLDAEALKVSVNAKGAILYNPKNGAVLFEKKAREPHYPASITKIATALFVLDAKKIDLDSPFIASSEALRVINAREKHADPLSYPSYILEHDGVTMGIKRGETVSLRTLLYSLMLQSSNDAANVIAENCSGSIDAFMKELNLYLREKGIVETRFQNPHGLLHPAQITTAYDIAKIAGLAFENKVFMEIDSTHSYVGPDRLPIINSNRLLKEGKYRYPRAIGGKTGYTSSSGYNLVMAAEDKGRRLIAVVLGCEKNEDCFKDVIALFETAFREKPIVRTIFNKGDESFFRQVEKAKKRLQARIIEDVKINTYPSEEGKLNAKIVWNQLCLPIKKDALVGEVLVEDERGNCVTKIPLYAVQTVEKILYFKWLSFFQSKAMLMLLPIGVLLSFFQFKKKRRKFIK